MRALQHTGIILTTLLAATSAASAQVQAPSFTNVPHIQDTGWIASPPTSRDMALELVSTMLVEQKGAEWLRLYFNDVVLAGDPLAGNGAELHIMSLVDGGLQIMNAIEVERWRSSSAYFNGDTVIVEVWARPNSGQSRVVLDTIDMGIAPTGFERSICGPTDDRLPSTDPRAGRLLPIGCTSWLIDDCAGCFLTAGHCMGNIQVVEFNVPPSTSSGSLQHPGPQDQYPVDASSAQTNGGQGVGNDWGYFGTFPNGTTGMTASAAQGSTFILSPPPPVGSQTIRITGYGTDSSPPDRNQVQQTHVGPFVTNNGTTVQYATDTTGGNSGSPVIWEQTGNAVGIHTHGGCSSTGGQNSGTSSVHSGLQAALASPQGVCGGGINTVNPPTLLPLGQVTTITVNVLGGVVQGSVTLHARPDASALFQSIAMTDMGSGVYTADLPQFVCGDTPSYYTSAQSLVCGQVFDPVAGPSGPYEAAVGTLSTAFADDFETNQQWQAVNLGASSGDWQRGVPVNDPGWAYDPTSDGDGSGSCYLTQNAAGNTDVDGGAVQLTSPVIAITAPSTRVDYLYYLEMTREGLEDALAVEVSANGGMSWTQVRRHDTSTGSGWLSETITAQELVNAGVQVGGTLMVRFTANDADTQSIVEAGIDGFVVGDLSCDPLAIGLAECAPAAGNSTGVGATLRGQGSDTLADNDVLLIAESLPASTVGYFLASTDAGFVPGAGGSSGNLCLGGSIGRYAGNVLSSGVAGTFEQQIDVTNIAQPNGGVAAMVGETWRFQAWYRDFTVVNTSNFTHALAITFD